MKWIVLVIVVAIVVYTALTLRYRKPGPMFEPYADIKDRANTLRLLSGGYQRITLDARRPSDPTTTLIAAPVSPAAGGLPDGLKATLVDLPSLPLDIQSVVAAPNITVGEEYTIRFTCTLPDDREQLASAQLYLRGSEIIFLPNFERLSGGLLTRSRENTVSLTVPAGALKPGLHRALLVAEHGSKSWSLQVH